MANKKHIATAKKVVKSAIKEGGRKERNRKRLDDFTNRNTSTGKKKRN